MHPAIAPAAEAVLLYVNQLRLVERVRECVGEFVVWDVGLGAAANAFATLRATRPLACDIRLVSFDDTTEPLRFALGHTEALGYFDGYESRALSLLEKGRAKFSDGQCHVDWELRAGDFPALLARLAGASPFRSVVAQPTGRLCHAAGVFPAKEPEPDCFEPLPAPDAILFDPFSPAKNPAMWTLPLFRNLFHRLDPARRCALATYSRSTMTRVALLLAGFHVGAGLATGAKEETTVAANRLELLEAPLDRRWLQKARRSHSAEPLHEPRYRQARLAPMSWEALQTHPQFH